MSRINQKPAVADLHRQQILKAAEVLFTEKGYEHTRIEDISRASGYSRRTLYAYYQSKEDILCHIVEKGLLLLKQELESALEQPGNFMDRYRAVCMALWNYQQSCPHSLEQVNRAKAGELETGGPLPVIGRILNLGTEINRLMAEFLQKGKDEGAVRPDVHPEMTVMILWSSLTALFTLVQTKGVFLTRQFALSKEDFLEYGCRQIAGSILKEEGIG